MKAKVYYIVESWFGSGAMLLGDKKVLWHGTKGTLFELRKDAVNSIARTLRFSKRMGFNWHNHKFKIQKVESEHSRGKR